MTIEKRLEELFDDNENYIHSYTGTPMIDTEKIIPKILALLRSNETKPDVSSSLIKVYKALYNPMIWESAFDTLSVHLSKEGAEKAIAFHKMEQIKEWEERYPNEDDRPYKFGTFEGWKVQEVDVLL